MVMQRKLRQLGRFVPLAIRWTPGKSLEEEMDLTGSLVFWPGGG